MQGKRKLIIIIIISLLSGILIGLLVSNKLQRKAVDDYIEKNQKEYNDKKAELIERELKVLELENLRE